MEDDNIMKKKRHYIDEAMKNPKFAKEMAELDVLVDQLVKQVDEICFGIDEAIKKIEGNNETY